MGKRRDPVAIGNVGAYTEKASEYLMVARDKLIKDIKSVLNNYKGVDAELQVDKFIEKVNKLNSVIQNLDYYGKYMLNVSSIDRENLKATKNKFIQMMDPIIEDPTTQTLALDSIKIDQFGGDINEQ